MLVPVVLRGSGDAVLEGMALLDTGATRSGVRNDVAERLALAPRGKRVTGGLGGEVVVEHYIFQVGIRPQQGFPFFFPESFGFELKQSFGYDALIGMDLIAQIDLELRRNGTALLRL